jgi:hypothetical protein
MKATYTPYPQAKPFINTWFLEVEFMHGDADAYTTEVYEFKSEADFLEAFQFFNGVRCQGMHRDNERRIMKELGELEKKLHKDIRWPGDATTMNDIRAAVDRIADKYYFDSTGAKLQIEVSE